MHMHNNNHNNNANNLAPIRQPTVRLPFMSTTRSCIDEVRLQHHCPPLHPYLAWPRGLQPNRTLAAARQLIRFRLAHALLPWHLRSRSSKPCIRNRGKPLLP
jgi:hypothetical protein